MHFLKFRFILFLVKNDGKAIVSIVLLQGYKP